MSKTNLVSVDDLTPTMEALMWSRRWREQEGGVATGYRLQLPSSLERARPSNGTLRALIRRGLIEHTDGPDVFTDAGRRWFARKFAAAYVLAVRLDDLNHDGKALCECQERELAGRGQYEAWIDQHPRADKFTHFTWSRSHPLAAGHDHAEALAENAERERTLAETTRIESLAADVATPPTMYDPALTYYADGTPVIMRARGVERHGVAAGRVGGGPNIYAFQVVVWADGTTDNVAPYVLHRAENAQREPVAAQAPESAEPAEAAITPPLYLVLDGEFHREFNGAAWDSAAMLAEVLAAQGFRQVKIVSGPDVYGEATITALSVGSFGVPGRQCVYKLWRTAAGIQAIENAHAEALEANEAGDGGRQRAYKLWRTTAGAGCGDDLLTEMAANENASLRAERERMVIEYAPRAELVAENARLRAALAANTRVLTEQIHELEDQAARASAAHQAELDELRERIGDYDKGTGYLGQLARRDLAIRSRDMRIRVLTATLAEIGATP